MRRPCQTFNRWCSRPTNSRLRPKVGSSERHSDVAITGFTIDSQRVRAGDLFFAIRGERLDGHRFVAEAIRHGASGAIVSDASAVPIGASGEPAGIAIVVPDTTEALQMIAQFVRRRSGARVVAITGSVGKTTTKELVAAFFGNTVPSLSQRGKPEQSHWPAALVA